MPSTEVFIPKKAAPPNGLNIGVLLSKKEEKGEVGIEIEVEGKKLPHHNSTPLPWVYVEDHSLRGEENAEYVLKKPIKFTEVPAALKTLWTVFKEQKSKLDDSNRTSVHVHLNCQSFYLNRLTSFMALYFIVEEVLTEWCGEHRVGNLFCLRAKDAPAIITYIKDFIKYNGEAPIQEFLHYSGLNANALKKYGSLEIRTLRGCSDPSIILDWIELLEHIYNLSEEYPDPRTVCTTLSSIGPLAFFDTILGKYATMVRKGIAMSDHDVAESVYEGVRLAQDLCYCRDWDLYKPMKLKPDMFGRNQKDIARKMQAAAGGMLNSGAMGIILNEYAQSQWDQGSLSPTPSPMTIDNLSSEPDYDDLD